MAVYAKRAKARSTDSVTLLDLGDDPFDWDMLGEGGDFGEIEEAVERPRDAYIDAAKGSLADFFEEHPDSVFYQRQLQVLFEREYFHWITVRALVELVQQGVLAQERLTVPNAGTIVLYRLSSYRYWKRDADKIVELVNRFSDPEFTSALGAHGETMFDAALPTAQFAPRGRKVRKWAGREWTRTNHDLDRVFERDGIAYGAEIKNTLSYIDRDELQIKVEMCGYLGLIPLFIVRMAPKSYVKLVEDAGGFTLIFKYQLYPHGHKAFADEVRTRLGLPTDSPARIEDGTVQRLLGWHLKKHKIR